MTTLKTAIVAASIAFAGPVLAGGSPTSVYFPTLEFPTQNATATRDLAAVLKNSADECTQLEQDAGVQPNACGTLSTADLAKRKLIGDE